MVKVAVQATADWSDFVFDKDYKLPTFKQLEDSITQNKHLPGIPGATEVCNNGLDLGKMDALLLQKIEELSLYVLELKKENQKQEKEISKLLKQNKEHD